MRLVWLTLPLCLVLLASDCRRRKRADEAPLIRADRVESASLLRKASAYVPEQALRGMLIRTDITVDGDGGSASAYANIIWLRDSAIWISVKKLGVEGARVLITPDSVGIINRMDQTYMVVPLSDLMRTYGIPGDFEVLQRLLIGSAWYPPGMVLESDTLDGLHRLTGQTLSYKAAYGLQAGDYRWRQGHLADLRGGNWVSLGFSRFKNVEFLGSFPYFRRVEAYAPSNGRFLIELELSEVVPNGATTYRFDVPEHYKRLSE
jgi:hypothetical protein